MYAKDWITGNRPESPLSCMRGMNGHSYFGAWERRIGWQRRAGAHCKPGHLSGNGEAMAAGALA